MATTGKDKEKRGRETPRDAKRARKRARKMTTGKSKANGSMPAKPPAKKPARKTKATTASAKPARKRPRESIKTPGPGRKDGETAWRSLGDAPPRKKKSKLPAKGEQRGQAPVRGRIYPFQTGKDSGAGSTDNVNPWVISSDTVLNADGHEDESRATPEVENTGPSRENRGPTSETPGAASPETKVGSRTDAPSEDGSADEGAEMENGKTEETTKEPSDAASGTMPADDDVTSPEDQRKRVVAQIGKGVITDTSPKKKSQSDREAAMAGGADEGAEGETGKTEETTKEPSDAASGTVPADDSTEDQRKEVVEQIREDVITDTSPKKKSQSDREPAMAGQQETEVPIDNTADTARGTAAKDEGAEESPFSGVEEASMKQTAAETEKKATKTETKTAKTRVKKGRPNEIPVEDLASGVVHALGNGLGQVLDAGQLAASGIASGVRAGANVVTRLAARVKGDPNGRVDAAEK